MPFRARAIMHLSSEGQLHRREGAGTALVQGCVAHLSPALRGQSVFANGLGARTRISNEKPSVPVIETTLCRGAVAKKYSVPGPRDRNVGRRLTYSRRDVLGCSRARQERLRANP